MALLEAHAAVYMHSCSMLLGIHVSLTEGTGKQGFQVLCAALALHLKPLIDECRRAELKTSEKQASRLLELISDKGLLSITGAEVVSGHLSALHNTLRDELESSLFIQCAGDADYFRKPREGWDSILVRFPNAAIDVEEMRKCYALSRYAACVFHSLLVVEFGLVELGRFLEVSDPLPGWTATTQALKRVIEKKHPQRTAFEQANYQFLEQLQATTEALKNAWRNKISHVAGKLTLSGGGTFPLETAEEIMVAARGFMSRLADGLPETT